MSVNLPHEVRSTVTPELVRALSTFLGENEQGVTKAIEASVSTVLKTISAQAALDIEKLPSLISEVKNSSIPENIHGLFRGDSNLLGKGATLVGAILGNRSGIISSLISSDAFIKPSSASVILSCVTPLVLVQLGNHTRGMSNEAIDQWVSTNESIMQIPLPAAITCDLLVPTDSAERHSYLPDIKNPDVMPVWALLLLLLVLAAMLLLYFK